MEGQGLKPGSSYSLEARPTPVTVKGEVVSSGSSFSPTVNLPSGISPGVHTITLSGIGSGGENLVLTQSFTVPLDLSLAK
jgi:hexosaminidase